MASLGSKVILRLMQILNYKDKLLKKMKTGIDKSKPCTKPPKDMFDNFDITAAKIADCQTYTICQKGSRSNVSILFLHGGAYVGNFNIRHWRFVGYIVQQTGASITAVAYPLAPQHQHKEIFEQMSRLYLQWKQQAGTNKTVLLGDSAGGGMALSLNMFANQTGEPLPDALILISPWLDVTMENPSITETLKKRDPFISAEALRLCGESYAGEMDMKSFSISPMFGDTKGLAPTYLFSGTRDILYPDFERFVMILKENNIPHHPYIYPDMLHDFVLFDFPEAMRAKEEIAKIISAVGSSKS